MLARRQKDPPPAPALQPEVSVIPNAATDTYPESPQPAAPFFGAQAQLSEFSVRMKLFLSIQVLFLFLSGITGGWHFSAWSMLDTALLIQSLGMTALAAVLDAGPWRNRAFQVAILLYVLAVFDMGINVVVSGILGWQPTP